MGGLGGAISCGTVWPEQSGTMSPAQWHGQHCGPWRCVKAGAIISHFTHPWADGENSLAHGGIARGTYLQQRASHVLSWFPFPDGDEGDRLEMPCLLKSGVSALQWMGVWMSRRQDLLADRFIGDDDISGEGQ